MAARRKIPNYVVNAFIRAWNGCCNAPWLRINNVYDINMGACYQFAVLLHEIYGKKCTLKYNEGHCWVEMDGVHYDSESLYGVKDPKELSCNSWDDSRVGTHRSVRMLNHYWGSNGKTGPVRWDVINTALAFIKARKAGIPVGEL